MGSSQNYNAHIELVSPFKIEMEGRFDVMSKYGVVADLPV